MSSPIMAGIQALVNQKTAGKWGNPNTVYYALAKAEHGAKGSPSCDSALGAAVSTSCIFYDVTQGDNDVACQAAGRVATNCYRPRKETYGVLSISDFLDQPAFLSNMGWDFASGIGSVNAWNLVMNWPCHRYQF